MWRTEGSWPYIHMERRGVLNYSLMKVHTEEVIKLAIFPYPKA